LCGLNVLEKEFHCNGNSFLFWYNLSDSYLKSTL
jgi:hypothetical protein